MMMIKNAPSCKIMLQLYMDKPKDIPSMKNTKISMMREILSDIKLRQKKHSIISKRFKNINTFMKAIINGLNAVSITSLVISLTNPFTLIISIITTSISSVGTAILSAIDIDSKFHIHNMSQLQYIDLYRDINARLVKNHLSSIDLDILLSELNNRLSLVEDSSLPI